MDRLEELTCRDAVNRAAKYVSSDLGRKLIYLRQAYPLVSDAAKKELEFIAGNLSAIDAKLDKLTADYQALSHLEIQEKGLLQVDEMFKGKSEVEVHKIKAEQLIKQAEVMRKSGKLD